MTLKNLTFQVRQIAWRVLMALMIALPSSLLAVTGTTRADVQKSLEVPGVGILVGWIARNKVYKTANQYIEKRNEYADRLLAKAKEQLRAREVGGLRRSQLAAYVKVVELISREQKAAIQFAEAEKKAAHSKFINQFNNTAINLILSTAPAVRVLGALQKGISCSNGFIDRALDTLAGGGGGVMAQVQQVRQTASWVAIAGEIVGGKTGAQIRAAGNRIITTIDRPTAEIQTGLVQVRGDLEELSTRVSDLQSRGRQPTAGEAAREGLISAVTGDQADPAIEAIIDVLGRNRRGSDFRTRARTALIGQSVARCAAIGSRYREILFRLELPESGTCSLDSLSVPACSVIDVDALARAENTSTPTQPPPTRTPTLRVATVQKTTAPTKTAQAPTGQATQAVNKIGSACDVMPPGGTFSTTSNRCSCFATFSTEPGRRTVSISLVDRRTVNPVQKSCQSLGQSNDFKTVVRDVPLGDCGFFWDINYQGKKTGGYSGWSIAFHLDHFTVVVHSKDEYHTNAAWVESTAAKIEADIQAYIKKLGGGELDTGCQY